VILGSGRVRADWRGLRAPETPAAAGMIALVLEIRLRHDRLSVREGEAITLTGIYRNAGPMPLALAFWWQRTMRVRDAGGRVVAPGPGPVLPCGAGEELTILGPGERHERAEPLQCTQPAGQAAAIGWSYALEPGEYGVTLIFAAPPAHGFTQHAPDPREFRGRVESDELRVVVEPKPRGLFRRLLGR